MPSRRAFRRASSASTRAFRRGSIYVAELDREGRVAAGQDPGLQGTRGDLRRGPRFDPLQARAWRPAQSAPRTGSRPPSGWSAGSWPPRTASGRSEASRRLVGQLARPRGRHEGERDAPLEERRSRARSSCRPTRRYPGARSRSRARARPAAIRERVERAHHLVALAFDDRLQVERDEGIVLQNQNTHAQSPPQSPLPARKSRPDIRKVCEGGTIVDYESSGTELTHVKLRPLRLIAS